MSAVTRSFSQLISVLANKCQDVLDKFSPAWVASVSVWFRSKERPVLDAKEMKREPFFAQSLTLVPRFLLLSRKETLATQAKFSHRFQLVLSLTPRRKVAKCYRWFSHDITKIHTTKLSILPRFYFNGVKEQLKTNFHTNFRFKRVLRFVIDYAWISKLLRDAACTWRPRQLSCRLKKWPISGNFAI